ncbi:MAG: lysylphosphatidylglycerol synthase transmembrane domain-containing protein [Coriobacteriia bacterium]
MSAPTRRRIDRGSLLKAAVSALVLLYLLRLADIGHMREALREADARFLAPAVALVAASVALNAWRWLLVVNQDGARLRYRQALALTVVGSALNTFLPASGGDFAKCYYGYRWYGVREELLASSMIDKVAGALALFLFGAPAALSLHVPYAAALFGALAVALSIVYTVPRIVPWRTLDRVTTALFRVHLDPERMLAGATLSPRRRTVLLGMALAGWVIGFADLYCVYRVFTEAIPWAWVMVIGPLTNLAYLFPLTLAGLGSAEAVIVWSFARFGEPAAVALLSIFLLRVIAALPAVFGLALLLFKRPADRGDEEVPCES